MNTPGDTRFVDVLMKQFDKQSNSKNLPFVAIHGSNITQLPTAD